MLSAEIVVPLVTSSTDPAIDQPAMLAPYSLEGRTSTRLEAYLATSDPTHLVYLPGAVPVLFTLRPLSARALNALVSDLAHPQPEELWQVVQRCLSRIEGAPSAALRDEDVRVLDPLRNTRMLSDEAMERVAQYVGLAGLRELGERVLRRAVPPSWALAPFASRPG